MQRQGNGNEEVCSGNGEQGGKMVKGGGVNKATRIEGPQELGVLSIEFTTVNT